MDNEALTPSPSSAPGTGWLAVSELAEVLDRPSALLRQYIHRAFRNEVGNVDSDVVRYVARPSGGRPEMWVAPVVATVLHRHYSGLPPRAAEPLIEARNEVAVEAINVAPTIASEDATKEASLAEFARIELARLVELERRAAVVEVLEAEVERLVADRAKMEAERDEARRRADAAEGRAVEAARRADNAETLVRRARGEADRWRAEAEAVRLAWHRWRRALDGVGRWSLWRRRLPPEPVEFTAGPAIEMRPAE